MDSKYNFLIDDVVSKFGEQVENVSIAKKLSETITLVTNSKVSYNTIRRLFGLIKSEQNTYHLKTLNVLSRYCGYINFIEHEKHHKSYKLWKLINMISYSSKKIENFTQLKKDLQDLLNKDSNSIILIGLLTNKLLLQKNEEQLVDLYTIKINNIYAPNMLMPVTNCCNLMASSLRQYKFKDPKTIIGLANKETFIRLYMHHFIDYSSDNQSYIDILTASDDKPYGLNDKAYKYLFLDTIKFFRRKELTFKGLDIAYSNLTNDFVRGRWIAISYLRNKKEFNFKKFYKSDPILLVRELLVFALIENDISTIKDVCSFYKNANLENSHWYLLNEKVIIDLFLALNSFMEGDKVKAVMSFKLISLDENSNFQRFEHNTAISLYIQIIIEGASDDLKIKFKEAKKRSSLSLLSFNKAAVLHNMYS